jgi:hypothetical protein
MSQSFPLPSESSLASQYLSVKLKTLNQVGWGAIAWEGFPGLWRMAFDALVTQHLLTFVGWRLPTPIYKNSKPNSIALALFTRQFL